MKRLHIHGLIIALTAAIPRLARAQDVPDTVSFTARLTDGGAPMQGAHEFIFRMYDAAGGGNERWNETVLSQDLQPATSHVLSLGAAAG